jgi:ATP-binding cassette subfamily B (MDR/TAP) protein 1
MSAGIGFSFFFMFAVYSLGFWYGGRLITNGEMLPGDILTVFFSIMVGAMGIGSAAQLIPDIAKAKGAASNIFAIIDRNPEINSNEGGLTLGNIQGKISFNNVKFAYPTRPETPILRKMNLIIQPGQTVALVGPSGSGKSTVIQLLERFYDPKSGEILVDDSNLSQFDLKWFRRNIGLVSQEPILFSGTITENILFGRPEATQREVEEAAKKANAYKFITKQKDGFDTKVGEKGTQLSGGQKQRVAIARAILKNPKILLLDEATSALDAESEYKVQDALDKLMRGRTTIIIAHRLTTVKNADVICVMDRGRIVEMGTHKSLLDLDGVYANLVSKQLSANDEDKKKKKKKKKSKNVEI